LIRIAEKPDDESAQWIHCVLLLLLQAAGLT
jgi:hypothetical protein